MDVAKQISCKSQYSNNGLDKLTRLNKQMKIGKYITTTGMIITF